MRNVAFCPHVMMVCFISLAGTAPAWASTIGQLLFTEKQIAARVAELADEITRDYAGKKLLCVGLLNGALVFVSDILRKVKVEHKVDFMVVSSYAGTNSTGNVKLKKDLSIGMGL